MKAGWYVCKTLLACDPDVNRRSLYYTDGKDHSDARITFNRDMKPWTAEHEAQIKAIVSGLNALGATVSR